MVKARQATRVVRTTSKGQITIPAEMRERLGIDRETPLFLRLVGDVIEITPLEIRADGTAVRRYTRREIEQFLSEDALDAKTAKKVKELLGR